jgi:hypothetical protein
MLKEKPLGGLHEIHEDRSNAMHRRGHAYYGTGCPDRCDQASRWAARRLITPRALLNAARDEACTHTIAAVLNVTRNDVLHYLADLDVDEWLIMQRLIGHELR